MQSSSELHWSVIDFLTVNVEAEPQAGATKADQAEQAR